ncbi:MAG: endolytic transglycosylase MltG [Gemmatimonadota bacterium]|nr:MAG: endolytic transglycosylase MltG [Gemmatimonadota bacterium]
MRPSATSGLLALLSATAFGCGQTQTDGALQELTIPRGATLAAVAETLETRGLVRSANLFAFYARMSGRRRAIQAGTYDVPAGATNRELLALFSTGRPALRRLVVPEGLFLTEVAAAVEQQLGIPSEALLAAARDSALRSRLAVPAPTLEGYLYPSTYLVRTDAGAAAVVRQMVGEFELVWREGWDARLDTLDMTRHELVTLASIIEGEVRYAPDRPYVSSVYHNRLRRGMRLQADPTVAYALGQRRRLFERDYQVRSPYNTYVIDGLPPGPIGAPSVESLEAALYPARTDFLFFVARDDGQHVFSRTYAEHLRAIREVRRGNGT